MKQLKNKKKSAIIEEPANTLKADNTAPQDEPLIADDKASESVDDNDTLREKIVQWVYLIKCLITRNPLITDVVITHIKYCFMKEKFIKKHIFGKTININSEFKNIDEAIIKQDFNKAQELITRKLMLDPQNQELIFNMSITYCSQNDFKSALSTLGRLEKESYTFEKNLLKDFINLSKNKPIKYTEKFLGCDMINEADIKAVVYNPVNDYTDALIKVKTQTMGMTPEMIRELTLTAFNDEKYLLTVIFGKIYYNLTNDLDPQVFKHIGLSSFYLEDYTAAIKILEFTRYSLLYEDSGLGLTLLYAYLPAQEYKKALFLAEALNASSQFCDPLYFDSLFMLILAIDQVLGYKHYTVEMFFNQLHTFIFEETVCNLFTNNRKDLADELMHFWDSDDITAIPDGVQFIMNNKKFKKFIPERSKYLIDRFINEGPLPDYIMEELGLI